MKWYFWSVNNLFVASCSPIFHPHGLDKLLNLFELVYNIWNEDDSPWKRTCWHTQFPVSGKFQVSLQMTKLFCVRDTVIRKPLITHSTISQEASLSSGSQEDYSCKPAGEHLRRSVRNCSQSKHQLSKNDPRKNQQREQGALDLAWQDCPPHKVL